MSWVPRADGKGNEIAGISQEQMDAYSSRTVSITERMPAAVESWTAKYGRAPNKRELLYIRQEVTLATRHGKEGGAIDWDALTARWDAQLGGELASVAPRVSALRGHAAHAPPVHAETGVQPSQAELTHAVQRALAVVQSAHSTWTRSDFLKQLALVLPVQTRQMAPEAAVALLQELTDEALAGSVEEVVCLEAPQWPPLPDYLRRELDGRSVYTRPGTTRYATRVQLAMEEQLLREAQRQGAPHLPREQAAGLLGADAAVLETRLRERAQDSRDQRTGSGLRLDQGAAVYHALTSTRTVEVITGPAGSGKTRALAEAARAWRDAGMGRVLGIATAQAARNVLASAGVHAAENSSVFLGHLPGRRGALGIRDIGPGTLLVIDEASMMSMPDLLEIVRHAARHGAKVIIAGDQEQLAAVESGGGMMLLARRLGYVQLAEAVRFTAQWERDASLRLRTGDASALDEYHEHGRIRGADPDQAMDDAARTYVAHYLAGRDALLMIHDRDRCREASRRIRDDLIHLGLVERGPEIELAAGARASAGDLIICRQNDHGLEAGEPGRTLANGDTLRIESIRDDGTAMVRRALDCDPDTGARRWTDPGLRLHRLRRPRTWPTPSPATRRRAARSGSASPLVTGTEDRQWLYVAMTRGTDANTMIVFTRSAKIADARLAPGQPPNSAGMRGPNASVPATQPNQPQPNVNPTPRDAIAVAADILEHDGSQESALETQSRALANADHLAVLNAIWQGETAGYQTERYRRIVLDALPAQYAADGLTSPQATWLWRTLRAAEAAGLDAGDVVRQAVGSRSLTGARDVASVIDARIRRLVDPLVPQPLRPWSEQVPQVADPERQPVPHRAGRRDGRPEGTDRRAPGRASASMGGPHPRPGAR